MGKTGPNIEQLPIEKELFISSSKHPHPEDLEHFENCSGCGSCDYMMQFFSCCEHCNTVIDKQYMYYDHPGGNYYCEDCLDVMPKKNTNSFVMCGYCGKRDVRGHMVQYHENFDNTWTCCTCVHKSVINSRFEIIDL